MTKTTKPPVDWYFSCGRCFLVISGYVVAMEGDVLRDPDLCDIGYKLLVEKWGKDSQGQHIIDGYEGKLRIWTTELIKHVATVANGGVLP